MSQTVKRLFGPECAVITICLRIIIQSLDRKRCRQQLGGIQIRTSSTSAIRNTEKSALNGNVTRDLNNKHKLTEFFANVSVDIGVRVMPVCQ